MGFVVMPDECIACGTCMEECPSDAINQNGIAFAISDKCIECGACLESCPTGAIVDG